MAVSNVNDPKINMGIVFDKNSVEGLRTGGNIDVGGKTFQTASLNPENRQAQILLNFYESNKATQVYHEV